ncbi:MAG: Ig-like domain-containing protein [Polyangiales bacterium]
MRQLIPLCLLLCACGASEPDYALERVSPDVVDARAATALVIHGRGFLEVAEVSLGSNQPVSLGRRWQVRLGSVFETDEVERLDSQRLSLVLPAGLPRGDYDLTVVSPAGRSAGLPDALSVQLQSSDELTLSLETRADGEGERVRSRQLQIGDTLRLFAVFRDANGDFVAGDEPVRFTQAPTLGALSEDEASSTVYTARSAGETKLTATADSGATATLELTIEAEPPDVAERLEIVPESAALRAGDSPLLFSVRAFDAEGRETQNVGTLTWTVDDGELAVFDSELALLTPEQVGSGTIAVTSSHGLAARSGRVVIEPGVVAQLTLRGLPDGMLQAGDPIRQLTVTGRDAFGNTTEDLGELTWEIDGSFGELDPESGRFEPVRAGSGRIVVRSSLGPEAESGELTVAPGRVSELVVVPNTLVLTTDDTAVQFGVSGRDAYGNPTADFGELSWQVADGQVDALSDSGRLEPERVGSGTIEVESDYGPTAESGTIQVRAGRAASLEISPNTYSGLVGSDPQVFTVSGLDARGNVTGDLGQLTFSIASGPIGELDPQSGVFTPLTAGDGTIAVDSSYGVRVVTGTIHVDAAAQQVSISGIRATDTLWVGQRGARIEVDVRNDSAREVVIAGVGIAFADGTTSITSEFVVQPDPLNVDRIPAGATRTLTSFVDDIGPSSRAGTATITATVDVFPTSTTYFSRSASTTSTLWISALGGVAVDLTAPVPPNTRFCAGATVAFSAAASGALFPGYSWRLPGGTPATSSLAAPSVKYTAVGAFPFDITVTDTFGLHDAERGQLYVGEVKAEATATYPTGPIILASPTESQSVPITSFPRSDLLRIDPARGLKQCDGTAIATTGHNTVTAYSDRGLLDATADVDPIRAGIQLALTSAGVLGSIPLRAPSHAVEGLSTVYIEAIEPTSSKVTAAGDVTFRLTDDRAAPTVEASLPASDCTEACLAKGEPITLRFSEPMNVSTLSNVLVQRLTGTDCSGAVATDLTGSTLGYESITHALYITPPALTASSYALRVTAAATMTDTAATPNGLMPFVRCVVVGALDAPAVPTAPVLSALTPSVFSPDGDGGDETTRWNVRVDDPVTRALRLRLRRGRTLVWVALLPVAGAGTYQIDWDGTDGSGRGVVNGAYRYDLAGLNRAGVASPARTGFVEVQTAVRAVLPRRRD